MKQFLILFTLLSLTGSFSLFAQAPKQAPKQEPKKEKAKKVEPKSEGKEEQKSAKTIRQ
ncbi:MAG: hypothetical protein IPG24_27120 [Leptospiraceae bacterium]|nr:hypothetical protein [Leptospiraceae bacterium]